MYSVDYACGNCGWRGALTFDKGTLALECEVCPRCGCRRAHKAWLALPLPVLPPARIDKGFPPTRPLDFPRGGTRV